MKRLSVWMGLICIAATLACSGAAAGDDSGQELLDKATAAKLSAETMADLGQVVQLCQEAIAAGLDDGSKKFANELLASTLSQRAEIVCQQLFERPINPGRGQQLVKMALSDLEQTLAINPDQAQSQYLIGRLYAHLGQEEKALKALDNAVRLLADDPVVKSKALMIRGNLKSDPAQRAADFDEAVKLQPHDPDVLRFRATFELTQGNFVSAIADLQAAAALDPKDADTLEMLGVAQSLAEKYDDAMDSLNKSIELAPESASAHTHRARVRAIKGDSPAALADVEQAIKLQPGSITARELHAQLLGGAGKFDEALTEMRFLMQAMPGNPEVFLQVALLCQAAKQPQRALAAYDKAVELDPKNASAFRGRADVNLSLGKQSEAVNDYESALKVEPKNSGALNNLAWVLATSPEKQLRDGKRAIELATLACEVTEYKQAHILSTLAAGYAEVGDFATAVNWSKKAVELGPEQLKGQLAKELESYQAQHPWREAVPPEDDAPAVQGATPEGTSTSAHEDTANGRSRN